MKIMKYVAESGTERETGIFLRTLERTVRDYSFLLGDGWRCVLEKQYEDEEKACYHIDVQSDRGGGDYAHVKMDTLRSFPNLWASGNVNFTEFVELVESKVADSKGFAENLKLIKELGSFNLIPLSLRESLRDEVGITYFYGGIRIHFSSMSVADNDIDKRNGEIRIAFSGASQEQDLFFALTIIKALNEAYDEIYPYSNYVFALDRFKNIPMVRFWLELLKIEG